MDILFIADVTLKSPSSGSEQVLYRQARGLFETGISVTAITRKSGKGPMHIDDTGGVKECSYFADPDDIMHFIKATYRYPVKFYKQLNTSNDFQAVICHQPFICFALMLRKKLWKLPVIYVFHSPSHEEYLLVNKNSPKLKYLFLALLRKWIEGFCIKKAQKVIVLSRYMEDKVKAIHRIANDRICINPGGVDLVSFHPKKNRNRLKAELGLPLGNIHLLTIRNLDSRMGLDNLLIAIRILKTEQVGIHLTIGGEGPERKNLETMVKALFLDQEVTFTGFIPSEKLVSYYAAADFFILPTRHLEGFGLVTPESMACGTPVLGTPIGGTEEILSGFNSEFLFKDTSPEEMADGIQQTINAYYYSKAKYKSLRQRCRKFVEKRYSWDQHVEKLNNIISEVT